MVNIVAENKSKYTNLDYLRAVEARRLQWTIGHPNTRHFIKIVESNELPDCPVTREDILAAEHIFGKDGGSLKAKTVRKASLPIRAMVMQIPPSIMERYRTVVLMVDVMFVNKLPFFVTISCDVRFATAQLLLTQTDTLLKVKAIYSQWGFEIFRAHVDGRFESLRGDIAETGMDLDTASRD
jgi:hypothetical protein